MIDAIVDFFRKTWRALQSPDADPTYRTQNYSDNFEPFRRRKVKGWQKNRRR